MTDGDSGVILPTAFLPAAERSELSAQIDEWVFENLFEWFAKRAQLMNWLDLCSVNLSGQALRSKHYMVTLNERLDSNPQLAQRLCFKITEATAVANLSHALEFMKAAKERRCKFALDDFGSSVSSFAYLRSLPVDIVKFDSAFVRDIASDSIDCAMLRSFNQLVHLIGRKTIAKGVETKAVLAKLGEIGVDYVQGNLISQPAALSEAGFD
jgi:EAL domain-containing protein (putative c-di-GMP-specific phosphodiesterase class I)